VREGLLYRGLTEGGRIAPTLLKETKSWIGLAVLVACPVVRSVHADTHLDGVARDPYRRIFVLKHSMALREEGGRMGSRFGARVLAGAVAIRLPENASEPSRGWYVLNAAVRLTLNRPFQRTGSIELEFLTDGHSAGYIEVHQENIDGQPAVRWAQYELLTGGTSGIAVGSSVTLHFRNYLQYAGVHPGVNVLGVQAWQFGAGGVRSAKLLSGSWVGYGILGPPKLQATVAARRERVHVGDALPLHYSIRNRGFPGRDVGMAVGTSGIGITVTSTPSRLWGWIIRADGTIWLRALAPGKYRVSLVVGGATGTGGLEPAIVRITIEVLPSKR